MSMEARNYIIKLVFNNIQDAIQVIAQIVNVQEGEIRSLYLSPKGKNGVREMIIEYEGGVSVINSLIKKAAEKEGCVRTVVTEFPATLIHPTEEVHE